ncbi:MAG: hypothetical protein H6739_42370 [Alphaproteobacteria bacterium]|nr:hypothetical protein [Alphaproteobacteria bacterium]
MRADRSSSASLLHLCLLGLVAPPSAAAGRLEPAREPARVPECTPVQPSSGVIIGEPTLSALPEGGAMVDLAIGGDGTHWAVGEGGRVLYRTYGSGPWTVSASGTPRDLNAITMGDYSVMWAVGDAGTLLRWQGEGWSPVDVPRSGGADLQDVAAWPPLHGAVSGAGGALHLTDDGGQTWTRVGSRRQTEVTALTFPSPLQLLAGRADGSLLIVSSSGAEGDWTEMEVAVAPGQPLRAVYAWDSRIFLAVTEAGALWSTWDGGVRWQRAEIETDDPIRALVPGGLGLTAVHDSGALSRVDLYPAGIQLAPIKSDAGTLRPAERIHVVDAVGTPQQIIALTTDGRLLEQQVYEWFEPGHPCGRPFEIDGRATLAPVAAGGGWNTDGIGLTEDLPAASRAALAAAWLQDARAEHASVASFARFSLRLLALGAPAGLVADAQAAMGDEIRHARVCFGLASRYAGEPLAPGPLPMAGALCGGEDLAAVAVEVLREGAVGETLGALLAEEMRQRATDPQARAALDEIAADEARHAQMAWRFLRWAVEQGGEDLRAQLAEAAEQAIAEQRAAADAVTGDIVPAGWAAHGRLRPSAQRRVSRRALRQVVRPCLAALLAPSAPPDREGFEAGGVHPPTAPMR